MSGDKIAQSTGRKISAGSATNSILRAVSRSFYISIRILPSRLREPVGLAYLLARSTDTVADTAQIARDVRIETLQKLSDLIQGKAPRDSAGDLATSFAPLQTNTAERKLLESLPSCLERLAQLDSEDRDDVREVLAKITQGQMLDLQHFSNPAEVSALATPADLDRYTYLVAGCVGEFWTRLCFRHIRKFAAMSEAKMLVLGKQYGMGLQLINILRDAGSDLRVGRCYFPEADLTAARMTPSHVLREPERFQPIYRKWIDKAGRDLESGMQYSRAIRNRRVRAGTVLPALIGARTLALLRDAGPTALRRNLKVPRRDVRGMIWSLAMTLASRKSIDTMFQRFR
ncbi:MAG: squalene/phytoene synthase family protein [Verrucomicrobiota bacterium]